MKTRFRTDLPAVLVPGRISGPSGSRQVVLALDTGATVSIVAEQVLTAIGYARPFEGHSMDILTPTERLRVNRVEVASLAALGMKRTPFLVVPNRFPPETMFHGLLGLDFLAGKKLCLDFATGELELT